MAVIKANPTLNEERIYTDVPVRGVQGDNFFARENYLFEATTDTAAPGTARTIRGHTHNGADSSRDGRGILRVVDGGFYFVEEGGAYITTSTSATTPGESIGTGHTGNYENAAGEFTMGIAYVSPGVESIKVEYMCQSGDAAVTSVVVKNITDGTSSSAQVIADSTSWYTSGAITVTRNAANRHLVRRIELDIWFYVDAGTDSIVMYHAFPFEYTDQP